MCYLLLVVFGFMVALSGCRSADLNKSLNTASQLATGPCAQAVAGAVVACKADPVVGPVLPAPKQK